MAILEELTKSEGLEAAFEYDSLNEAFLGFPPGIRWSNQKFPIPLPKKFVPHESQIVFYNEIQGFLGLLKISMKGPEDIREAQLFG